MNIWLVVGIVIGMILTLAFLWLLVKEIKKSIKDSNDGKTSSRCELD